MIDALAMERQFLDHLAPLWLALPDEVRGTFRVHPALVAAALERGVQAEATPRPERIPAHPPPRHDGPPLLVAAYGDVKVGRRLGYGPFALLQHGIGQSYNGDPRWRHGPISGSYSGGPDHDDVTLHLVPNERSAEAWRRSYPGARVEIIGAPRLDSLPAREPGPGPVVAISFHWETPRSLGPEAQTALGDYLGALPQLAAAFEVIGHAHPKGDWQDRMRHIYGRAGIEFVPDFDEVCRRADVYVCDNSSSIYEFASTGRPVVLLNARWYRRDVEHGLRFWEAAGVGLQVDRPADLVDTVREALRAPESAVEAREAALRIVYPLRYCAAERGARALVSWINEGGQHARPDPVGVGAT